MLLRQKPWQPAQELEHTVSYTCGIHSKRRRMNFIISYRIKNRRTCIFLYNQNKSQHRIHRYQAHYASKCYIVARASDRLLARIWTTRCRVGG